MFVRESVLAVAVLAFTSILSGADLCDVHDSFTILGPVNLLSVNKHTKYVSGVDLKKIPLTTHILYYLYFNHNIKCIVFRYNRERFFTHPDAGPNGHSTRSYRN